jgi:hypothetical protein
MPFNFNNIRERVTLAVTRFRGAGLDRLKQALGEFSSYASILRAAGFDASQLEVVFLPPKMTAHFKIVSEVSEDKLSAIVRENPDKKLLGAIASSLIQTTMLQRTVQVSGFELDDIEVSTTGGIPNVVIRFKAANSRKVFPLDTTSG